MLRQIRLVVFDLDYVVLDSVALKTRALRQSLIPFAESLPLDVRLPDLVDIEESFLAEGSRWIRSLDIGFSQDQLIDLEADFRMHEVRFLDAGAARPYPGMADLLSNCREEGLTLALGAEGTREYVMAFCDRNEMDRVFEVAFCTEEFGLGSIDEMLTEIMNHAEVNPSETVVLATRPRFFEAGRDLGILTVGCGWGILGHSALSEADFQSVSLQHALPIIRQADAMSSSEDS